MLVFCFSHWCIPLYAAMTRIIECFMCYSFVLYGAVISMLKGKKKALKHLWIAFKEAFIMAATYVLGGHFIQFGSFKWKKDRPSVSLKWEMTWVSQCNVTKNFFFWFLYIVWWCDEDIILWLRTPSSYFKNIFTLN